MSCSEDPCQSGCGTVLSERIRYFTGRHMTARDFRDEQWYHRSHRYLHNRMLHGWGVVCGLEVRPHREPACRERFVQVGCGLAIDCCGREIVLPCDLRSPEIPWKHRPNADTKTHDHRDADREWVLLLGLCFSDTAIEPVPVLYIEAACSTPEREQGRCKEGYQLTWQWVRAGDLGKYKWTSSRGCAPPKEPEPGATPDPTAQQSQTGTPAQHHGIPAPEPEPCPEDDCFEEGSEHRCCLDLDCPKDHCVPLAVVRPDANNRVEASGIDVSGRPSLHQAVEHLTHICWINWPHGGVVSPSWLRQQGRLMARFDRRLQDPQQNDDFCAPAGVNACTFLVQVGETSEDLDFVAYSKAPYLGPDKRSAIYELEDRKMRQAGNTIDNLCNHIVRVTIKCDFLLDCHGNAVDGNHLGGRRPTGDGIKGGQFESWFMVLSDEDCEKHNSAGKQPPAAQAS